MDSDGGLTVVSGYVDMTGTDTAMATIAADVFGISVDMVRIAANDTSSAPHAGVCGGSMVTYCLGSAVAVAAQDARVQVLNVAAQELEIDQADLEISGGEVRPAGFARSRHLVGRDRREGHRLRTVRADRGTRQRGASRARRHQLRPRSHMLRVDPDTGEVRLLTTSPRRIADGRSTRR